jgi:hypothetical protein
MKFAMLVAAGLLVACATPVADVPVAVTDDDRATAGCSYVGLVSSVKSLGDAEAVRQMQAQVHDRGGDTLLLSHMTGSEGLAMHGEAYRCGPHHPVPPIPPPPQ